MRIRFCHSRTSQVTHFQAIPTVARPAFVHRHFDSNTGARISWRAAGPARRGARERLAIVAFRDEVPATSQANRSHATVEHVPIPIDYYRLLQVPRVSRPDAVRKAYDQAMKQAPATAYSADTLFSRAVLLKAAAESLIDPDLRRAYDAKLAAGHSALRVSQQDMPGALVVLQEIGEFQLVLDLGSRWLELNGGQPDASDVAAAVALAYCDRAGERLTAPENQGAVLPACDDLDAALARLRRYGMAQQLQAQIVSALRDLAPEYACELAALPLGTETAARRAKGVALMRGVLRSAAATVARDGAASDLDDPLLGADEDPRSVVGHARRMLQRGRDVLTCTEQVSLLPDALRGSGLSPHPDVLYDGALANIVDGFRNGWPHSVHTANQLLLQLEGAVARQAAVQREKADLAAAAAARRMHYSGPAAASTPGVYHYNDDTAGGMRGQHGGGGEAAASPHAGGVALERAVCAVLLGDYAAAAKLLKLEQAPAASTASGGADEQLRSFVMEHAPSGTQDLRPGLRALATRWLEGVALASFRDTAGQPVMPLDKSWFKDPRVVGYVQVWRMCRNEHVLAAAHFLCNLVPTLLKMFASASVHVAAAAVLAASRAQRLTATVASSAAASPRRSPSPPAGLGGSALHRSAAPRQGVTSPPPAARVGARPVASSLPPVESPAAPAPSVPAASANRHSTSAAPKPNPFGHPYGKSLREMGPDAMGVQHSSAGGSVSLMNDDRHQNSGAMKSPAGSRAVDTPAAAAGTALAVATAAGDAAGSSPDFRRRFAASAAVDAAVASAHRPAPGSEFHSSDPRSATPLDGPDADVAAEAHDDDEDLDEHPVDVAPEGLPRRGMTEQDLRAHLAGLEAAMWDSELPDTAAARKRLIMWAAAVVAVMAALFHFVFRRPDAATIVRSAPGPPAVVSITVSAFVTPN